MSAMFVAGAAGDLEDEGVFGALMAEDWELVSLNNLVAFCLTARVLGANTCVVTDKYVQFAVHIWLLDLRVCMIYENHHGASQVSDMEKSFII